MRDLPRGTVTFLFTDIEGSTRLLHELGPERYADALAEHRRVLREAFVAHGGVEVDTQGDAFFVAFPNAAGALAAAEASQRVLASGPIRVRMGVHTGEPLRTEEGYVGVDVHRGARVAAAGHGGQVLLSASTRDLVDADVRDLGEHRLKDLTAPERLYQLGHSEFPPLKTLDATNLPVAATALLGREHELEELLGILRNGTRLLTLTGPGGTGKTRLALQVAAELVGSYGQGVFWVPLAGVTDPGLVIPQIAQTIGAPDELAEHLRDKEMLLLVDNLEHLLAAAPALGELLGGAKGLRLLVTSRAPLHLRGEREYPLDPLAESDAVTLFVERARETGRFLVPDETIAAICRRLDGLPLAVELAAARTKLLAPATLLERLDRALPLLTSGARDAPERQQTLSATIQWSYDLLDDESKQLFTRLGVFAGSFSLTAAEDVCSAHLDGLAALVDLSLLKSMQDGRFLMLETIREFALDRLAASRDHDAVRRRHAEYYLDLAEQGEPQLWGADDREWLARLDADRDNFRAAFASAQELGASEVALRLVVALRAYWSARGSIDELRLRLEEALQRAGDALPEQRADALQFAALTASQVGAYDETERYATQMLEIARALGDREREVSALTKMGGAAYGREQLGRASAFMEQALDLARELGKPTRLALSLSNLAVVALQQNDVARAAELSAESLSVGEGVVDSLTTSFALLNLAEVRRRTGDHAGSADAAREALQLAADRQDAGLVAEALEAVGAALSGEDVRRASQLLGGAAKLREATGARLSSLERKHLDEIEQTLRTAGGDETFDVAFARGRELTFADAVELGLGTGSAATMG